MFLNTKNSYKKFKFSKKNVQKNHERKGSNKHLWFLSKSKQKINISTSATCLTCSTGFYLQSLTGPALCLNTCPTHTYPDAGTLICQTCDATCNACQSPGTAVSCMSCSSGSYLQSTSGPAKCLATCPSHTYQDSSTNTCQTCDASCTNCQFPGTSSNCMSCPSGLFLQSLTGPARMFARLVIPPAITANLQERLLPAQLVLLAIFCKAQPLRINA